MLLFDWPWKNPKSWILSILIYSYKIKCLWNSISNTLKNFWRVGVLEMEEKTFFSPFLSRNEIWRISLINAHCNAPSCFSFLLCRFFRELLIFFEESKSLIFHPFWKWGAKFPLDAVIDFGTNPNPNEHSKCKLQMIAVKVLEAKKIAFKDKRVSHTFK